MRRSSGFLPASPLLLPPHGLLAGAGEAETGGVSGRQLQHQQPGNVRRLLLLCDPEPATGASKQITLLRCRALPEWCCHSICDPVRRARGDARRASFWPWGGASKSWCCRTELWPR